MASRKRTPSQQSQKTHTEPRTTFKKDRTETIRGYFSWKEVDCVLIKTIARRDLRPISVRVRILRKRSSYRPFNLLIRAQIRIGTLKQSHNTQMYKKIQQHYKQVQRQSSFYSVLYRRCSQRDTYRTKRVGILLLGSSRCVSCCGGFEKKQGSRRCRSCDFLGR